MNNHYLNNEDFEYHYKNLSNTTDEANIAFVTALKAGNANIVKYLYENRICDCRKFKLMSIYFSNNDYTIVNKISKGNEWCWINCNLNEIMILININNDTLTFKQIFVKACKYGNLTLVIDTYKKYFKNNTIKDIGKDALKVAIKHKNLEIIKWLIETIYIIGSNKSTEDKIDESSEDKTDELSEDKINESTEDKINESTEDKINESTEDKINESTEDKINESTEDKINESTEDKINESTEDKINESTEDKINELAELLCKANDIQIIELILPLIKERINRYNFEKIFLYACEHNDINIVKYLHNHIKIYKYIDYSEAFCRACKDNKLDIAKYLYNNTIIDINHRKGYVLIYACVNNYFEMVKWLYNININDQFRHYGGIRSACKYGHIDIIEWILKQKSHNHIKGIFKINNYACFRVACINRHLKIAQLILSYFNQSECNNIIHGLNDEILYISACRGYIDIVDWLKTSFIFNSCLLERVDKIIFKHLKK